MPFQLNPTRLPAEARARGRYVLENDEHVDVLVARSVPTVDGIVKIVSVITEPRVLGAILRSLAHDRRRRVDPFDGPAGWRARLRDFMV